MKKILLALILGTVSLSADAYMEYRVPDDTNTSFIFDVVAPGEYLDGQTSTFDIPYDYVLPILESAYNWTDILNFNTLHAAEYVYKSDNVLNAFALSPYVKYRLTPGGAVQPYKVTAANAALHGWIIDDPGFEDVQATITVGTGLDEDWVGWQTYSGKHALYHNELPDLYAVMNHEIMHSIGISSAAEKFDGVYRFSKDSTDPLAIYDYYMRIFTGSPSSNPILEPTKEIAPYNGQAIGPVTEDPNNYDVRKYSPYFVGNKTISVLGGDADVDTAKSNIVAKGGLLNYSSAYYKYNDPTTTAYPTVYGMPLHPYDDDTSYDLSHLELRNSYMSHQDFRNWLIPMEAELAVLIDSGFTNIDLRRHFGRSYYLNGTDIDHKTAYTYVDGFSAWNGSSYTGVASTVDQAVGIHIYGNYNDVTQTTKDIKTMGEGSFGVRVDGVGNTFRLADDIHINADGKENIGIGVTWGNNHTINVGNTAVTDHEATVTANGEDGIAVSFDFGSNLFGRAANEFIKGSYINHYKMSSAPSPEHNVDNENQGPLVKEFNVNGILSGSKAAIYIADNAHVETININNGSKIYGDIISEWNSVSSQGIATVQVASTKYTDLNFNGTVDMNGNITGNNDVQNTLNMKNTGTLNFAGGEIIVNTLDNNGTINILGDTAVSTVSGAITQTTPGTINVTTPGSALRLGSNVTSVQNTLNLGNTTFDTMNGSVGAVNLSTTNISGNNQMNVDIDLESSEVDTLHFANASDLTIASDATIQIANVNLINADKAYTADEYYIQFVSSADNNQKLLSHLDMGNIENILTPIFKYNLGYTEDATQGGFVFSRGATKDYNSYNPSIVASSVAAQFGGYLSQLNMYDQAFQNIDMTMLMTQEERKAVKMANRYASTDAPKVFSPTYLPEKDKGMWVRPYTSFEKVDLRNGPKVESISYGTFLGGDSPMYETKNGWDVQYSAYAAYNGSHQNYSGNSVYQNGGSLGGSVVWYKDNFFTALTANVGASVANASTMYGSEDMTMLSTGVASKTGYNWELAKGKFIIQPSYLMSYSFVNTFDYTNAAGVRISSDPLHAINIAPGLKFIGNLKNGWQPYIGMQMVWNIMDDTKFRANDVALPDMSVKPYFQYGVGVQKRWGDRFTGFFQTMIRNGGRNGVALTLGFRWALGK